MSLKDQYNHHSSVFYLKRFSYEFYRLKQRGNHINTRKLKAYHYQKGEAPSLKPKEIGKICGDYNFLSDKMEKIKNRKAESDTEVIISKIIREKDFSNLSKNDRRQFLVFINSLYVGTSSKRRANKMLIDDMQSIPEVLFKKSLNSFLYEKTITNLIKEDSDYQKVHERELYTALKYPDLFKSLYWSLILNETQIPFFTSDNPLLSKIFIRIMNGKVVRIPPISLGAFEWLFLPISPRIAMFLYQFNKIWIPIIPSKLHIQNRNVMLALNNKIIRNAEHDVISSLNSLNVLRSTIQINPKCLKKIPWQSKKFKLIPEEKHFHYLIEHKPKFRCSECQKPFEDKRKYAQHINDPEVHKKRTIKCPYCPENKQLYKSNNSLNMHIKDKHKNLDKETIFY